MTTQKSKSELLEFLDYLARKGLLNKTTASARKAAVQNVLGVLDDDESADVTHLDLDAIMHRFHNLNGMKYKADSLASYKSRVKSSIDDFVTYLDNPMSFRPGTIGGGRKAKDRPRPVAGRTTLEDKRADQYLPQPELPPAPASLILPIPIRANLTVYVQGLPHDLSQSEAAKIANVVRAMAVDS